MNISSTGSLTNSIQYPKLYTATREPEGMRITADSCMFADMDRAELSQKGIVLAEKRESTIPQFQKKPILGEGVIDNKEAYNIYVREYWAKHNRFFQAGDITNGSISIQYKELKQLDLTKPLYPQYAQFHFSSHDFFDSDTDFLISAAGEYAKIDASQDFLYRPTQDSDFIYQTLDWLYGKEATKQDADNMRSQIDVIVRELAEQIKETGSADLSKLNSKFSFRGNEISVTSLIDTQKITKDFVDVLNPGVAGGNEAVAYGNWGRRGLVESLSSYYYNSLGAIGTQFKSAMERQIAVDFEKSKKIDADCCSEISEEYKQQVMNRHKEIYERFKNLEQSSFESLNQSF